MQVTRYQLKNLIETTLGLRALIEVASVFAGTGAFSTIASTFGTSQTSGLMTIWGGKAVASAEALGSSLSAAGSVAEGMPASTAAVAKLQTALGAANTHIGTTGGGQAMATEVAAILNGAGAEGVTFVATEGTVGFELTAVAEAGTFAGTASTVAMVTGAVLAIAAVPALALYSLSTYKELENRVKTVFRINNGNSIQTNPSNEGNALVSQNGVMAFKPDGKKGNAFAIGSEPMKQIEAVFPYIFTNRGLKSALRTEAVKPANGTDEGFAVAQKVMTLINDRKLDGANLYRGYMERIVKPGLQVAKIAKKEAEEEIKKEMEAINGIPGTAVKGGEEVPAAKKKKKKTGWEGYIEAAKDKEQAKKVKTGFEEMAKNGQAKNATFRNWVTFYNELRNDEPSMKAIGKKKGQHMSPKDIIAFYDYLAGRKPNFGSIKESHSRGSLYRRRYHGRY